MSLNTTELHFASSLEKIIDHTSQTSIQNFNGKTQNIFIISEAGHRGFLMFKPSKTLQARYVLHYEKF